MRIMWGSCPRHFGVVVSAKGSGDEHLTGDEGVWEGIGRGWDRLAGNDGPGRAEGEAWTWGRPKTVV